MSFPTDWDVDFYKTDYESEEHWELRRRFMEVHKDKFPEDELVCLAQVFTNVEFLGCKYPEETMQMVAHLSQDVAKDFRDERSKRIKRTFVKASDAAEARAKGRSTRMETPNSNTNESITRKRPGEWVAGPSLKRSAPKIDLIAGSAFGGFVLFVSADRNCIQVSGQKSGVPVSEMEAEKKQDLRTFVIRVGETVAGSGTAAGLKEAKKLAFEAAIKKLQKECHTIRMCRNPDRIDINKDNQTITCSVKSDNIEENKLDQNNIGYKMMQKLGWSGGGLGSKKEGRANPVDYLIKNDRKGLGNDGSDVNKKYFRQMLDNYIKSDDIRDLYFESGFTKDERATLHQIASEKNLKSASSGKEPNRRLMISKKNITPLQILEEVLLNKNPLYINKYEVKVPKRMKSLFPDHAEFQSEEQDNPAV